MVKLDGREMKTVEGTHKYLQKKFDFPNFYGGNLDGLWDLLIVQADKLEIELHNEESMYNSLGSYSEDLLSLFEDLSIENENIIFRNIIKFD